MATAKKSSPAKKKSVGAKKKKLKCWTRVAGGKRPYKVCAGSKGQAGVYKPKKKKKAASKKKAVAKNKK